VTQARALRMPTTRKAFCFSLSIMIHLVRLSAVWRIVRTDS
jgi:hypothetical protein